MATFTLDTSTLATGIFKTQPVPLSGEFADLQIQISQSGTSQDCEVHFIELLLTITGVNEEAR